MAAWDHLKEGDRVEFETRDDQEKPRLEGTVISAWDTATPIPQLDIRDGQGRVWVRRAQDVIIVARPS
jgi:bifunctional DNA-binding transcriptional regulator/antitoxin component of YhaV-PrlF toxin-antitoxin module